MKTLFKYRLGLTFSSIRLGCTARTAMRVSRAALILPLMVTGMGSFTLTAQGQQAQPTKGCPAGTTTSATNLIVNGNFAQGNTGFTSDLPFRGTDAYPDDPVGGYAILTRDFEREEPFPVGVVDPNTFPGDPSRAVASSNTYFYSNPGEASFPDPTIWQQTVTVTPNTTYNFLAYFDNLLVAGDPGVDPQIQLQVNGQNLGDLTNVPQTPDPSNSVEGWIPIEFAFQTQPGQTQLNLSIVDRANNVSGDDFGLTAIGFNQCVPNLGVAKSAGTPVRNANGTFTVPYTLTATNYGTDPISNLQLTDDLTATFANASSFVVSNVQSTTLRINSAYDGRTNTNLLTEANTLAAGASATVTFDVTITPGTGPDGFGPFNNTVRATGTAPGGIPVNDTSDDGINPDPDADRNPNEPGENDPTAVSFTPTPQLGVAKAAGVAINNNDDTFTVPYTITVQNAGDAALTNLQVTENLTTTFAEASGFSIVPNSLTGTGVTVNPNFNGTSDTNLLAGTDSLAVGGSATITFRVRLTPGNNLGPYNNTAVGNATGPNATPVSDESTNGTNTDPNSDGNPNNDNVPTTVTLTTFPRLGVAKTAGVAINNNDGSFTVPYTINVQNAGDAALTNLQVTENLANTFAEASSFSIVPGSLSATGVTVNPNFNGTSNTNLLTGTDSLAVGINVNINFNVRVTPGNNLGPYNNIAVANATSPTGTPVTDNSTTGTSPDANGDGDPTNDNLPTIVNFEAAGTPRLRLVKRITAATRNGAPLSGLNTFVDDPADPNDTATGFGQLQLVGVPQLGASTPLQSGDEVEYTIYFLSDGSQPASNIRLCDLIPTGTTFVANSILVDLGNANSKPTGSFFSALAPLPAINSCPNQTNPNGAVIVNLGNVPNTPGSNFGFLRFRTRIN